MLEGKPRESLVLYDTAIEVSETTQLLTMNLSLIACLSDRLQRVSILTILSRGLLDVSCSNALNQLIAFKSALQ